MAETSTRPAPALARFWQRISPSLVPILAVITALLITIPFMVFTGGGGDFGKGLNIAGTAYSALLEGSVGITVNPIVGHNDFKLIGALAQNQHLQSSDLRQLAHDVDDLTAVGIDAARKFEPLIAKLGSIDANTLNTIATSVPDMANIGIDRLNALHPLMAALGQLQRADAIALVKQEAALDTLTADQRAALNTQLPGIDSYSDADLLADLKLINDTGLVKMQHIVERLDALQQAGITPVNADGTLTTEGQQIIDLSALPGGPNQARGAADLLTKLDAAGVSDIAALTDQIAFVREMYTDKFLTNADVTTALNTELDAALANNLLISRPGSRLLIDRSANEAGVIMSDNNTPNNPNDDYPDTAYLRLGSQALIFFPSNFEEMLVRSVPFIITGLAVALGFKAGLFNIGAEGQLYAGGIFAVWIGFSPIFANLPTIIHVPLALVAGILGGALLGAIPGALKAYTGAHEVITTIMLNYVAVLLVDWLIKSTNPVILLDTTASTPRTPFVADSARLPLFNSVPWWGFVIAGIVVLALGLYARRERLQRDPRYAIRPAVNGVLTAVGGLFLGWVGWHGLLHLGFAIMLVTVWFTDWFLNKTTLGFELRTVGSNPDAARYAGMSVKRNIILAMALSGALAGLAGSIEITSVQFNMQPAFFAGLGFDAIAVALLARTNPRNMIWAGLLWGGLLAGAGLMQVRADISIDLVKIIQALIIMFIAADAIIRYLWRVPEPSEKTISTFSKGWGS